MSQVAINNLSSNIIYESIVSDFVVVQFTKSDGYIKFGAQFIDEFSQSIFAKGVVFENGISLYTLFSKEDFKNIDLGSLLRKGTGMDVLSYSELNLAQLKLVSPHLIVQLLVNSLSTPKSERLKFNNLTGKLYLFNDSLFEKRKFKDDQLITKIPAIEFKVHRDLKLELRTTTFTSLLLKSKLVFDKKPLSKYAKYTYVHATKSMRRILQSESFEAKDVFVIKQEPSKKTVIPFMDFSELDSYLESKIGQLSTVMSKIKDKLSDYLILDFEKQEVLNVERVSNRTAKPINDILKLNHYKFHIINSLKDEGADYVDILKKQLYSIAPDTKVSVSQKPKDESLNIRLVHNKDFYQNLKVPDIYDSTLRVTQHITVEDFDFNNISPTKAILKELLLKNDIEKRQISILDWSEYSYSNNLIFGIRKSSTYYFLTISSTGKLTFEKKEPSLFNQTEFDDLISIFGDDETIEGIVKNDLGQINIIKRTALFTLPKYLSIFEKLVNEDKEEVLLIADLKTWLSEIQIKEEQYEISSKKLAEWPSSEIKKSELLSLINHRVVKKKLAQHIFDKTGITIKAYMRDQSKYELMDSNLDIHSYSMDGKLYYYVGSIGEGMRTKISRASVIREISSFNSAPIFFDKLLPLMNVDFVRYGDLTVVPFPFKYLREWTKVNA